eukprot:6199904-Pleurochrysis_carterae.AAC.7
MHSSTERAAQVSGVQPPCHAPMERFIREESQHACQTGHAFGPRLVYVQQLRAGRLNGSVARGLSFCGGSWL